VLLASETLSEYNPDEAGANQACDCGKEEKNHLHRQLLAVSVGLVLQLHVANHEVGDDHPGSDQNAPENLYQLSSCNKHLYGAIPDPL